MATYNQKVITANSATGSLNDPPHEVRVPQKVCWVANHVKAVSIRPAGRYYERFKKNGIKSTFNWEVHYKIICPLQSDGDLQIEVKLKLEAQNGVTESDISAVKVKFEEGIETCWNNKFSLSITDTPCGTKSLPIKYKIIWVTSNEDYAINVHSVYLRADILNIPKTASAWVCAHEFGHYLGNPDEYSYAQTYTETIRYYKPDGTLDATIISAPSSKPDDAPDATIMSTNGNTAMSPRHAWGVAREVQELLTTKIGRPIQCNVI